MPHRAEIDTSAVVHDDRRCLGGLPEAGERHERVRPEHCLARDSQLFHARAHRDGQRTQHPRDLALDLGVRDVTSIANLGDLLGLDVERPSRRARAEHDALDPKGGIRAHRKHIPPFALGVEAIPEHVAVAIHQLAEPRNELATGFRGPLAGAGELRRRAVHHAPVLVDGVRDLVPEPVEGALGRERSRERRIALRVQSEECPQRLGRIQQATEIAELRARSSRSAREALDQLLHVGHRRDGDWRSGGEQLQSLAD